MWCSKLYGFVIPPAPAIFIDRSGGSDTATRSSYQLNIGATWEPDVFGRLRLGVDSAHLHLFRTDSGERLELVH